tara:strand:- start:37521 stop:38168 length:648 start_codon:yes stop_codon:yes gene_type:complete
MNLKKLFKDMVNTLLQSKNDILSSSDEDHKFDDEMKWHKFLKKSINKSTPYSSTDKEFFIRSLNLEVAIGNFNITPKLEYLDKKTIEKCRKLSKKGMVIGGSVLLKACGLIDRECGDIDVFWDVKKALNEEIIKKDNIINCYSDYGGSMLRYKVKLDNFGEVDIFQSEEPNHDDCDYLIDGVRFKDPISTLEIKLDYFRPKDAYDYWIMKKKLNI